MVEYHQMLFNLYFLFIQIPECRITWIIKNNYIAHKFIDSGIAQFTIPTLNSIDNNISNSNSIITDNIKKKIDNNNGIGASLGPHWKNFLQSLLSNKTCMTIIYS